MCHAGAAAQMRRQQSTETWPHLQGLDRRGHLRDDDGIDPAVGAHARRLAGRKEAVTVMQHGRDTQRRGSSVRCHVTRRVTARAGSLVMASGWHANARVQRSQVQWSRICQRA